LRTNVIAKAFCFVRAQMRGKRVFGMSQLSHKLERKRFHGASPAQITVLHSEKMKLVQC